MVQHKGQLVSARPRTEDVQIKEDITFKMMLLPKPILKGLRKARYITPSPIQKKALPLVRCGLDLIVQAKAGTGKTCVFTVAALEMVRPELGHVQAIILAPTREVALQITDVVKTLGTEIEGLKTSCFIGGYPVKDDEKNAGCHIAVGTPGRMKQLIQHGTLKVNRVRLFIMDEADKLMEKAFIPDINDIYKGLPNSKQVLTFSATYTPELIEILGHYMHRGQYITPQCTANPTVLIGVRQLVSVLPLHVDRLATLRLKERQLLHILRFVPFNQCLVFSNIHSRAESVCNILRKEGFGVDWIAGRQQQADRVIALTQLREQRVRILVTTDLTARGIDVENVNVVINLDLPMDHHTYLHRMGRAGRYGSHGMVITIISAQELGGFRKLLGAIGGTSQSVRCLPEDLRTIDLRTVPDVELEEIRGTVEDEKTEVSGESTDTEEKFSKSSSSSGSEVEVEHNNESNNSILIVNGGKDHHEGAHESSSDADEKLSKESSSDTDENLSKESSPDMDDKLSKKSSSDSIVETENLSSKEPQCVCGLYQVEASDLEMISQPSLFTVGQQEDHWTEVLPVTISEKRIPLNTKVALVGSKFVRIRSLDKSKSESEVPTDDFEFVPIIDFKVESTTSNDILTFEDLMAEIEKDPVECNSEHEECREKINEEPVQGENDVASKLEKIKQQLEFYKRNQETQENFFRRFDSFDVSGWAAVDSQDNILDNLNIDDSEIFKFNLKTCAGGKSHIEVQPVLNTGNVEDVSSFDDHIMTFKLEKLNLVLPTSLKAIADQFKSSIGTESEIPKIATANNVEKTVLNTTTVKCSKTSKEPKNKPPFKLVNGTKIPQQNGNCKINGDIQRSKGKTSRDTRKLSDFGPANTTNKNESKPSCTGARKKQSPTIISSSKSPSHNNRSETKFQKKPSKIIDPGLIYDTANHVKEYKSKVNVSRRSSAGTEDSGPYVDMSKSLTKWQELHDFDESDSETSSESDFLNPFLSQRIRGSYSDSSECSYKTSQAIKHREVLSRLSKSKSKKRVEKERKTAQLGNTEGYDTFESEHSNRHSFETATSQNVSFEDIQDQTLKSHLYYDVSDFQPGVAGDTNEKVHSHKKKEKSKKPQSKSCSKPIIHKEFSQHVQVSKPTSSKNQSYQEGNCYHYHHHVRDDRYSSHNLPDNKDLGQKKRDRKHQGQNVQDLKYSRENILDPRYFPDPRYFSQNASGSRHSSRNLPDPRYFSQNASGSRHSSRNLPDPRYFSQNASGSRHSSQNQPDPRHNNQPRHRSSNSRSYREPNILTSNNLFADWCSTWYAEMRQKAQQLEFAEYINSMTSNL